jgi:hypothetical protein
MNKQIMASKDIFFHIFTKKFSFDQIIDNEWSRTTRVIRPNVALPVWLHSRGLWYKHFIFVIYDRNDSGLYHKTTILANLALARSILLEC